MQALHDISTRIEAACARVGRSHSEITLIGASKTVPAARLGEFVRAGLGDLGENYVQEALPKIAQVQSEGLTPTWHLIGALQSNKAREAVRNFELVHTVDRVSLAKELDKEAAKIGKVQRVLIQVNVGDEESKSGISPVGLAELIEKIAKFEALRLEGLMSLPPYSPNPEDSRPFHAQLRELAAANLPVSAPILSMGMSRDFEVAIEEGATHVRVGTSLFGAR